MAVNPAPSVKILKSLDTSTANPSSIAYTVNGQTEPIVGAVGKVYNATSGDLIFTYTNSTTPSSTAEGYLFPMVQIAQNTPQVSWATGKTITDWTGHNNEKYYIEISVEGRSGVSSGFSSGELFWAVQTPTATIDTIGSGGTIDVTQLTVSVSVDLQQTTVENTVERYRMILTDVTNNTIAQDSDWIYGIGTGSGRYYTFTYTFYDLDDTHRYSVQFVAYTELGSTLESISNVFTVNTGLLITGTIRTSNNCDGGYISVLATITGSGASTAQQPNYILIQRAIITESPLNWVSVYEEPLSSSFNPSVSTVIVTYEDYYVACGDKVRYRALPVKRQGGLEIRGIGITDTEYAESIFNKFFILDYATKYGFTVGVAYDGLSLNQQIGVHQPLGATYPIIVRNANTKYRNGGFSITIMPNDFDDNRDVASRNARHNMVAIRKAVGDFLSNGAPKIIKDWNGNIWLVEITDNVNASFNNNIGMGIADISGSWTELGEVYDTDTLVATGLVSVGG